MSLGDLYFTKQTVTPEEVLPLAELFLRWPYKTADRIYPEFYNRKQGESYRMNLGIYELEAINFQNKAIPPTNYIGFLLCLKIILVPRNITFESVFDKFSSLFVLREDVYEIEKYRREYCAFPAGVNAKNNDDVCTKENITKLAPSILYEIFTCRKPNSPSARDISKYRITENNLWPWLGPIDPPINDVQFTTQDLEEVKYFIEMGKCLIQANEQAKRKQIARMVRFRYPYVKNPELASLIAPELYQDNPLAGAKQARRWLGKSK